VVRDWAQNAQSSEQAPFFALIMAHSSALLPNAEILVSVHILSIVCMGRLVRMSAACSLFIALPFQVVFFKLFKNCNCELCP